MTEEMDLKAMCRLIWERKNFIIGATFVCIILAGAAGLILPRKYEASLILEIGDMHLSPKFGRPGPKLIEGPVETAGVMRGAGTLDRARQSLNLDMSIEVLRRRLEVITYFEANAYLPILKVSFEGDTPSGAVEVLNALTDIIVERHADRSRPYWEWAEEQVITLRQKCEALETIIAAQARSRKLFQNYIDRGEVSAEEFMKELGDLDLSQPTAVDLLYLQGTALTEKQQVAQVTQFQAELDMSIAVNEQELAVAKLEISDILGLTGLSKPTAIVSPAVFPERPSSPKKALLMAVAGLLGLSVSILGVFFREYLKD